MQNLMIFEGHDVEVFELNGQVLFKSSTFSSSGKGFAGSVGDAK